ncbi:MAG: hypothetical protein WCS85_00885 [Candidatus Peribacteraceae bacterium]|jgi:hypothetical protein
MKNPNHRVSDREVARDSRYQSCLAAVDSRAPAGMPAKGEIVSDPMFQTREAIRWDLERRGKEVSANHA